MARLSDSGFRFLIATGFNAVASAFRFFRASLTTSWFTFLALTGLAALREAGSQDDALRRVLYDQDSDGFCIPSDSRAAGSPCAGGWFGNAGKANPAAWIIES